MFSSQSVRNYCFVRNQKIISSWTSGITVITEFAHQFEMDIKLSHYSMIAHPIQFNMCGALLYLYNNEIKQYLQPDWKAGGHWQQMRQLSQQVWITAHSG